MDRVFAICGTVVLCVVIVSITAYKAAGLYLDHQINMRQVELAQCPKS